MDLFLCLQFFYINFSLIYDYTVSNCFLINSQASHWVEAPTLIMGAEGQTIGSSEKKFFWRKLYLKHFLQKDGEVKVCTPSKNGG